MLESQLAEPIGSEGKIPAVSGPRGVMEQSGRFVRELSLFEGVLFCRQIIVDNI